jgi:hypothetical protein
LYEHETRLREDDDDRSRACVFQHRDDEEALHVLIDKLHANSSSSRVYSPEDNIAEALAEHLQSVQPS